MFFKLSSILHASWESVWWEKNWESAEIICKTNAIKLYLAAILKRHCCHRNGSHGLWVTSTVYLYRYTVSQVCQSYNCEKYEEINFRTQRVLKFLWASQISFIQFWLNSVGSHLKNLHGLSFELAIIHSGLRIQSTIKRLNSIEHCTETFKYFAFETTTFANSHLKQSFLTVIWILKLLPSRLLL
jgi:hypothetical protein